MFEALRGSGQRVLNIAQRQLQTKFHHASDFGVSGNWNPENAARFKDALQSHVTATGTQAIEGTYRGAQAVIHNFNPSTGLNVITTRGGEFISGWRLSAEQIKHLLQSGNIQ